MSGTVLWLNVFTGIDVRVVAVISGVIALVIFWSKQAGSLIDVVVKVLGLLMIGLTLYIAFSSHPPLGEALYRTCLLSTSRCV